jgi:hypothetical protein
MEEKILFDNFEHVHALIKELEAKEFMLKQVRENLEAKYLSSSQITT